MRRWWVALFNVVWVARGLPSALLSEVAELLREGRDFVVEQDAFEAARTHDRFERYCEEHLRAAGDAAAAANRSTAAARSVLLEACAAESDAWDRREHLRDQEVHVLETALALLQSPAVEDESSGASLLQLAARNRTMREEARLCQEDLDQVSKLKLHLEKKVNQTSAAVAQVSARVETGRVNVSGVKRAARQTVDRILGWDQSYGEQEARMAEQETAKAGAARAVGEATELLANFYTQPQAGTLSQLLGAGSEAPDLEALRDDTAWPANLLQVWPDCPERPARYALHHALANKVLAVLQTLGRVMQADADGTKHVAESVQAEARRVRGFRGRAAHETREHLARLKQDIKESDQALVVLKDRQHTEATQLQAVLDKMAQLQELCARVTAAQPKPEPAYT